MRKACVCVYKARIYFCASSMGKIKGARSAKISPSPPSFVPKTPALGQPDVDRSKTHETASPSPRCGFGWVQESLEFRLTSWMETDAQDWEIPVSDIGENDVSSKCLSLPRSSLPHIIGRGGHVIRALEDFCGVFIAVRHCCDDWAQVTFAGPRKACVLASFCGELIRDGHYSVMTTLLRHGL